MQLSQVSIGQRSADWLVPAGQVRGAVVFLHGYDGITLRDETVWHAALEKEGLACLCPHGGTAWWLDLVVPGFDPQLTPLRFLVDHVPAFLATEFPELPKTYGVCGFEMGGQGALQVAYRFPRLFPRVVAISPKIDFETWYGYGTSLDEIFSDREAARQHTAILQLNPLNWPRHQLLLCDPVDVYCYDGTLTLASKLSSSGVPFAQDFESSRGGFGWGYVTHQAERVCRFLAAGG